MERATDKQKSTITKLCFQSGYDPDDYDFTSMTKDQASEIISEMLKDV